MLSFRDSSACKLTEGVTELRRAYWQFRGRPVPNCHKKGCEKCGDDCRAWSNLAKVLKEKSIILSRYIRWTYTQLFLTGAPWVLRITSLNWVELFSAAEKEYVEMESLKIKLRLETLHYWLAAGHTVKQVIENELLDLGDAVRYAAARKAGLTDSAERLRRGAELDLLNEPVYMSLLSSFLG